MSLAMTSYKIEDFSSKTPRFDNDSESFVIHVKIPDLQTEKPVPQGPTDTVWNLKQKILDSLATSLTDGLNYGIFCPPANGKAGKFLDEERCWKEYAPNDRQNVEMVYKKRIYKTVTLNLRKVKEVNSKTAQKKFLSYVKSGNLEKMTKFLAKGLDPNYFDRETGETPFTLAIAKKQSSEILVSLVDGGAHLDFRNRDGLTPLHRAAQTGNKIAIKTLLSFGASPNYKDVKGLTPLYHCVCNDTPSDCVELLLREYALHGVTDDTGWTEVHQVCKYGRVQHLQHLLFYGANMNSKNSSGNTPLHVCTIFKQEECARLLLFRGADKSLVNFSNQEPVSTAILLGNHSLAELIRNFKPEDVVRSHEEPQYNQKRRTVLWKTQQSTLLRQRKFSHSTPQLNLLNTLHNRPGLPSWNDKQQQQNSSHFQSVAIETNDDSALSYDSDFSSSTTYSDTSVPDSLNVYDTIQLPDASRKSKVQRPVQDLDSHGSLNRLGSSQYDSVDSFYPTVRSVSPYAGLYRKKMEDEDGKTASIRSYPKRLTPSLFQDPDLFRDPETQSVDSPSPHPKVLLPTISLPFGDSYEETNLLKMMGKSDSTPNLLENSSPKTSSSRTELLEKSQNLLLSPPAAILNKRRVFGSTNNILQLDQKYDRSNANENARTFRPVEPSTGSKFRLYGSTNDLLESSSASETYLSLPSSSGTFQKQLRSSENLSTAAILNRQFGSAENLSMTDGKTSRKKKKVPTATLR